MPSRFPSFPSCCQPILEDLERHNARGARNCPAGHLISVEYARMIEERARAAEAAKQAEVPAPAAGGPAPEKDVSAA